MRRWLPLLALLAGLGCSISFAQGGIIDCIGQPMVHVTQLRGQVFDPTGVVIPSLTLILKRGDNVVAQTTSDENGRFDFKVPMEEYELHVQSQYFRAIPLKVHVGIDMHSVFHSGELRWIIEIAELNCSWATTRVAEFEKEIRLNNERLKRDREKNATQK